MLEVFLKTLPFFALIGVGYGAGRLKFFPEEATGYLTKFVFYFALTAMLFRFSANLSFSELFDPRLAIAYLWGTSFAYGVGLAAAFYRGLDTPTASIEAQCAAIGNSGFLGVPMLALLMGEAAVGPIIMMLAIDLIVFSSLLTILVTGSRGEQGGFAAVRKAALGLLQNPMIVAISLGLIWSTTGLGLHPVVDEFTKTLGAAATPGALFAIGASLASKSAERMSVAVWLSFCKLVVHPACVALAAFVLFPTEPFKAAVATATAALPVAGNIFILAQHYGVAPQRVSASILVSTTASVVTISIVISLVIGFV